VSSSLKGYKPDSARWPVLRHGVIFFGGLRVACFILNRSRAGAGLVLQCDVAVPLIFDLEIDGENMRRRCVAIWRRHCRVGVSFDMERAAEIAQDNGPAEKHAAFQSAIRGKEQSIAHLLSIPGFVAPNDVRENAVPARIDVETRASESREIATRFQTTRG
jgi:hypothetical protein